MNDLLGGGFGQLWIQFAEDNVIKNNVFVGIAGGTLLYSEGGNIDKLKFRRASLTVLRCFPYF